MIGFVSLRPFKVFHQGFPGYFSEYGGERGVFRVEGVVQCVHYFREGSGVAWQLAFVGLEMVGRGFVIEFLGCVGVGMSS